MPNTPVKSDFITGDGDALPSDRKGVVDIGSNSVRLVVYDADAPVPMPFFNEKIMCGIGKSLATTGRLDEAGVSRAILAMERFNGVISAARVGEVHAVATAAVRDASNGGAFVEEAEKALGFSIRKIDGPEEGRLSARGVMFGIPNAEGLVCDLGGASLEIAEVAKGRVGKSISLPLGPLRLIDAAGTSVKDAKAICEKQLAAASDLLSKPAQSIYLVGGTWRNLARVHMEFSKYPLHMLHQYTMKRADVIELATMLSVQSRKSAEQIKGISKKRAEYIPFGALALERMLDMCGAPDITISAHGLREGLLAEMLDHDFSVMDPLIEMAKSTCQRLARAPELCRELIDWTLPLFPVETPDERRLREVACWLSDIMWRSHPDYRGEMIFNFMLGTQFSGLDQMGRMFLAVALHERYPDGPVSDLAEKLRGFLPPDLANKARILGLALRFGITLAGASPGFLPTANLVLNDKELGLEVPKSKRIFLGESSRRRFGVLAAALERDKRLSLF